MKEILMNEIIDQANDVVNRLQDESNNPNEIKKLKNMDSFDLLRMKLFTFFGDVLLKVQAEDDFKTKVKTEVLRRVEEDEGVTFDQLTRLLDSLDDNNQRLTDSILSLFKPTPGTGDISPLIDQKKSEVNAGKDIEAFGDMNTNQLDILDKLSRVVNSYSKNDSDNKE